MVQRKTPYWIISKMYFLKEIVKSKIFGYWGIFLAR